MRQSNQPPSPDRLDEHTSIRSCPEDNQDGFHNIQIVRDEYIEPENFLLKRYRALNADIKEKFKSDKPEGYYYDPDLHDGLTMYYLEMTSYARRLVENENFNYFIIFVIILAGINVGVQTYPQLEDNEVLNIVDNIILIVFSFEVVVKMASEGLNPFMYFVGKERKWNCFDFTIVFLSLPFWGGLFGGGSLALLRLVRLMRLAKLIKKIPALQMIVRGLTGGLSSIAYILLLLILVFYLFAVTGFYLFSTNDPFHFGTLPIAMVTMFRCATLDAWSDVMYLNIFGCNAYSYLYVVDEADFTYENRLFWCENPNPQYVLSALYFVFFIVMSALVMLSLFIGAVTLSMNDSLVELKILADEKKKKDHYDKNVTKMFLANARVEKRKELQDGGESSSTPSVRMKLLSGIKSMRGSKADLERFKLELQLPPGLVKLHQQQQMVDGRAHTRSATLNHKKTPKKIRTPPPSRASTPNTMSPLNGGELPSAGGKLNMQSGDESCQESPSMKYVEVDESGDGDGDGEGMAGEECSVFDCFSSEEEREEDPVSPASTTPMRQGTVIKKSLSTEETIANEHQAQIAAKEIESLEKRKKVLSMIAEKNEGVVSTQRNFSVFIPEAIKTRMDRSLSLKNEQQATELGRLLRVAMGEQAHGEEEDPKGVSSFVARMSRAPNLGAKYKIFTEYCKFAAEHRWFVGMVTAVIVMAGVNVGAQTESRLTDVEPINDTLKVLDVFILTVFTIEVVLKLLAEGDSPLAYFHDGWNKFDFVIVVGSYVPGAGSLLTILRLLRLLRVLKLVKSLPQLAVIVNALIMGLSSIGYIGLILFLCFYIFAIAGMMLFRDNDPFHFGNLHISMFTLFRCSTLDDWSEVLYVNIYGCDDFPGVYEDFPEMCDAPKKQGVMASIYFTAFIVIGAQVLLTLFIGVVTTSMEQAKEIQLAEQKTDRQLASLEKSLGLSEIQMNCFRKAFALLDLDGGGKIEEDEVALGLQSINNLMTGTTIEEEIKKSDPLGVGIDLLQFIVVIANIPRCKHRRLIKRSLKRWRANKINNGNFYVLGSVMNNLSMSAMAQKKLQNQVYLDERPIVHSYYTQSRLAKDELHSLLFSYFQHHKLAFEFFQKNEYSTQLDHLAFMSTKLKRRHSCSNLPESQFEQYLCFGKEFNISDHQFQHEHSNKLVGGTPNPKSLRAINNKRMLSSGISFSSLTGSSKNFFKTLIKSSSSIGEEKQRAAPPSPEDTLERRESSGGNLAGEAAAASSSSGGGYVSVPQSLESSSVSVSAKSLLSSPDSSRRSKSPMKLSFSYGSKITPRAFDDYDM